MKSQKNSDGRGFINLCAYCGRSASSKRCSLCAKAWERRLEKLDNAGKVYVMEVVSPPNHGTHSPGCPTRNCCGESRSDLILIGASLTRNLIEFACSNCKTECHCGL